ncbi:MAG: septal ring lytic transglycosylase RlpA family protein [Candidatus Omnitrophica bacterium]|nr:septal ring lytic transglycosylase RlpA family protein [Candidatus Omnitrophota bacterium]
MKLYWVILICLILFCGCQDKKHLREVYPAIGLATWYSPQRTASGEMYQSGQLTCAMRKRGFGKYYLVCNLANNRCVEVRHNDFGPSFFLFVMGRMVDLSQNAFSKIADVKKGVVRVRIGEVHRGQVD